MNILVKHVMEALEQVIVKLVVMEQVIGLLPFILMFVFNGIIIIIITEQEEVVKELEEIGIEIVNVKMDFMKKIKNVNLVNYLANTVFL